MSIELVQDENPDVIRVRLDNVLDMGGKIRFSSSWTNGGCDQGP